MISSSVRLRSQRIRWQSQHAARDVFYGIYNIGSHGKGVLRSAFFHLGNHRKYGMSKKNKYRSKFEQRIAENLTGTTTAFEYEAVKIPYVRECTYLTDFVITGPEGSIFIEAKGRFTSADRTKLILVREQNPGIDIRILFQRSGNTLTKKSKTTYAQWASKNGFLWAEGIIVPPEWLGIRA